MMLAPHKRRRRSYKVLACLGLGLSLCTSSFGDASDIRARFLEEYRPHAQALEDYYGTATVKFTWTTPGTENTVVQEIEGKCDPGHYLLNVSVKAVKNDSGETYARFKPDIQGRNPFYFFTLLPKSEGGYILKDLALAKKGDKLPLCCVTAPFADYSRGMTFQQMDEDDGTNFLALEDRVWQNEPMKVLRVEYRWCHI